MCDILNRLYIKCSLEGDKLICQIPSFRDDIEGTADIAEEVLRIYGYDNLKTEFSLNVVPRSSEPDASAYKAMIRNRLVSEGMYEAATYSFITDKAFDMMRLPSDDPLRNAIRIKNPLGEDQSVMRTTLIHSMLNVATYNLSRKNDSGRLFEIANIYIPHSLPLTELPDELPRLCLCVYGKDEDFYTLKGIIQSLYEYFGLKTEFAAGGSDTFHPYRKAVIYANKRPVGQMGEIHPETAENYAIAARVYIAELDIKIVFNQANLKKKLKPLPKYPAIERDMAVVMNDNQDIGPVMDTIRKAGASLLEKVELFDIYKGSQLNEDEKSAAFSLTFRAPDRTLTDDEVSNAFNEILKALSSSYGARLR